jgi:hypothetical protein
VSAGTAWLNGAFSKVAKAGQVAGTKTRAKFNSAVSNLTAKVGSTLGANIIRWTLKIISLYIYSYITIIRCIFFIVQYHCKLELMMGSS